MPSQINFYSFNNINFLKDNPDVNVNSVWSRLLNFLNNEIIPTENKYPFWNSSLNDDGVFKEINNSADLPNDFYSSIVQDMVDSLIPAFSLPIQIELNDGFFQNWKNQPWNDSISQLIWNYSFALDFNVIEKYEGDTIYIKDDGTLDTAHSRGSIKNKNEINMRISDIRSADAGHSFNEESEIYEKINYVKGFNLVLEYWYWTDQGKTYKEYFDEPLILTFDREAYLKNYSEKYSQIFDDQINEGFKRQDIIDSLTKVDEQGWYLNDIKNFINFYNPTWYPEESYELLMSKTGHYYFKGSYNEEIEILNKLKYDSAWVIPWYNIDGKTYKIIREDDLKISAIQYGIADDRIDKNKGAYFLDFTREYKEYNINDQSNEDNESALLRLLMPQNKRRVEVEDLNRNFWVIAQSISSMMIYLFDPDGPYPKIIGSILNEIMQLWENVLFMWGDLAIQTKKNPDTVAKVVYISPENFSDYLSYDNFDFYEVITNNISTSPILSFWNTTRTPPTMTLPPRLVNVIFLIKQNKEFEDHIINYLREYRKKFSNKNVIFIPVVRLGNYEENNYKRIICPGIYRYFINNQEIEVENELPGEVDENGIFRTTSLLMGETPAILLNSYRESFLSLTKKSQSSADECYVYDLNIENFTEIIAGISEKEDQTGYSAISRLSKSELLKTTSKEKVYGLIKPLIYIDTKETTEYYGAKFVNFYIEAYDLAKYFMDTENNMNDDDYIRIGEDDFIIYRNWYNEFDSDYINENISKIDKSKDVNAFPDDNEAVVYKNIEGTLGYYLGELLSEKRDSSKLDFNVISLTEKTLQPTTYDTETYKSIYGRANSSYPDIIQDEKDDKITLINILKNTYDKWNYSTRQDIFWDQRRTALSNINGIGEWDPNQTIRVGYLNELYIYQNEKIEKNREEVKISNGINNQYYKWGIDDDKTRQDDDWIDRWKKDAWEKIDNLPATMTESTILFVSGKRNTLWVSDDNKEAGIGGDCYAKDGLLHHLYNTTSPGTVSVGAALRIPIGSGDAAYSTYPLHTDPTSVDYTPWEIGTGSSKIWRQNYFINGRTSSVLQDGTMRDDTGRIVYYEYGNPDKQQGKDLYTDYLNRSLYIKDSKNKVIPRYEIINSASGGRSDQYFILRKEEDSVFTDDNWLIEHIRQEHSNTVVFYEYSYNNEKTRKNLIRPFSQINDVEAKESIGTLNSIRQITSNLDEYYNHTYQKYVYNIIKNYSDEYKTSKKLYELYDEFDLRHKLFGWIRIMDIEGNEQFTICLTYNNPYDYSGKNENFVSIVDNILRKSYTIAGEIKNKKAETNSSLNYEQLEILIETLDNSIDKNTLKNCIYMGSFCQLNYHSAHTNDQSERIFYEDKIMGHFYGLEQINQINIIYKKEETRVEFLKMVQNQFNMHSENWYDTNIVKMYKKIAEWIVPQENYEQQLDSTYSIYLYPPYQKEELNGIEIRDTICLSSYLCYQEDIYVFGPEQLYGRRRIGRYPYKTDLSGHSQQIQEIESYGENLFGTWPVRPANMMSNEAPNWKDDYNITLENIDIIRQGYKVVSTTVDGCNYEKYKTRGNSRNEEIHYKTYPGRSEDEDKDFNNIWDYLPADDI